MNKEQFKKIQGFKTVEELMAYAESINEPLTRAEAEMIVSKIPVNCDLSDEDLNTVSGGWKLPWQDDDNPPDPKYSVGERVAYMVGRTAFTGKIISISTERKSFWGLNPEWEYTIAKDSGGTIVKYESDIVERC